MRMSWIKARHTKSLFLLLLLALLVMFVISISIGRFYITPVQVLGILTAPITGAGGDWTKQAESVVYTLRLPRAVAAVLIGAALAISGASYQSVFKNPLVAPDILGVSTGAALGASLCIVAGLSGGSIQIGAFAGGIIAVACAVMIPKIIGKQSVMMLVLAGIITGGIMGSLLGLVKYLADAETELPAITYWQLGSLVSVEWKDILSSGIPILLCGGVMFLLRWQMNLLTLNEEETHMMMRHPNQIRYAVIVCATILTASSVCISGAIGWIGLVIPHFARILGGPDNRRLLPLAAVMGALFLLCMDTMARSVAGSEIPLSILTGLIGAPFYFYLLVQQRLTLS